MSQSSGTKYSFVEEDQRDLVGLRAQFVHRAGDQAVGSIVNALHEEGELDNTFLIFTSDNGYMHGEHRAKAEKASALGVEKYCSVAASLDPTIKVTHSTEIIP